MKYIFIAIVICCLALSINAQAQGNVIVAVPTFADLTTVTTSKPFAYVTAENVWYFNNGSGWAAIGGSGGGGVSGYTLAVQALSFNPADGLTYTLGNFPRTPNTSTGVSKIYIRKAGTIKIAEIYSIAQTAVGTNEDWSFYIRKNGSTDTLIATVGTAVNERIWSNAALSIAVVSGDYIEVKMICPTWATNPTAVVLGGYIYIES